MRKPSNMETLREAPVDNVANFLLNIVHFCKNKDCANCPLSSGGGCNKESVVNFLEKEVEPCVAQ